MTTHPQRWPAGTPAWADLTVPSLDRAMEFYGPLLGWDFETGTPDNGGYTVATVGGRAVAGLGETVTDRAVAPQWCLYFATDDVHASVARAGAAGGRLVVSATPIPNMGTMAIATDPTGAVFGLWQSGRHTGWDVADEPGAVVWTEVMSADQPLSLAFYSSVLELGSQDMSAGDFVYATLRSGDAPVAGVGRSAEPAAWTIYVAVPDVDAAARTAATLGGGVLGGVHDSPFGRTCRLHGPFGETLAIITPV